MNYYLIVNQQTVVGGTSDADKAIEIINDLNAESNSHVIIKLSEGACKHIANAYNIAQVPNKIAKLLNDCIED